MSTPNHPTAEYLRELARDGGDFTLHRGDIDHIASETCECFPLILTSEQILAYNTVELTRLLAQHYRVH